MRAVLLLLLLLALAALLWSRGWRPPDRFNPWAPLDLRAPPDLFVRYKLQRLAGQPEQCRAALTAAGVRFSPLVDRDGSDGCGWSDAVRLRDVGAVALSSPLVLSCPLAATTVLWTRQVLQPLAEAQLGQPLVRLDHLGSFACRDVYHRAQGALSEHARADALDVNGFELADGRRVLVRRDWSAPDAPGRFLHEAQQRGCRLFGMVLGPDYNLAHQDHFHLQRRGWGYCR